MHKVRLTYFRPTTGKYYSEGEYESDREEIYRIWDEVRAKRDAECLPGLCSGHGIFIVSVDVPGHPHEHPRLIL